MPPMKDTLVREYFAYDFIEDTNTCLCRVDDVADNKIKHGSANAEERELQCGKVMKVSRRVFRDNLA